MSNLPNPSDSIPQNRTKRRAKAEPTEAELQQAIDTARTKLRDLRTRNRTVAIERLGTLAFNAGLAPADDNALKEGFADLAKRLLHGAGLVVLSTVGIVTLALTLGGCVSHYHNTWQQAPPSAPLPGEYTEYFNAIRTMKHWL